MSITILFFALAGIAVGAAVAFVVIVWREPNR
jgi:hypothetical protein